VHMGQCMGVRHKKDGGFDAIPPEGEYKIYDEPYLHSFRSIVRELIGATEVGEVTDVLDLILAYVEPQVVFRFQVMTNDFDLRHDALVLWDDGMVQCENTDYRWWLMTDYNVSMHVVMAPLLIFPEGERTILNCMGWNNYAYETQKWINFQASASLPKFSRVVASQGPEMRKFENALDHRKRTFFQLYQMVPYLQITRSLILGF